MNRQLLLLLFFAGFCDTPKAESVRKVDYSEMPEMKDLATRARQVGDVIYPRILALLSDGVSKLPRQFDVVFEKDLDDAGQTSGTRIHLNASWLSKNPTNLDMVLVHEMTHVAQQYKSKAPSYWKEGIADYVRYKLDYTNGWSGPQCSTEYPHYTSGYWCTGAFLLFLDYSYGSNVIRQLNNELRRGSYSDQFFEKTLGKSIDLLWAEFQKTPAYTPAAAEVNRLHEALGFVAGKPPKDIDARLEAYLKQHPGVRLAVDAAEFLSGLQQKGQLPGFFSGEHGQISFGIPDDGYSADYPATRTLFGRKDHDSSTYHYTVVRASNDSAWKLHRAWRTGSDGRVIEEYPVR